MAERYEITPRVQRVNRMMSWLARKGMTRTEVLTTTGRTSGEARSVPVSPIVVEGVEYLVSPYGEVSWVQNVRAEPNATLRHGSKERRVRLEERSGPDSAGVVAAYHSRERFARPYMDLPESPSLHHFEQSADQFPVFRVVAPT